MPSRPLAIVTAATMLILLCACGSVHVSPRPVVSGEGAEIARALARVCPATTDAVRTPADIEVAAVAIETIAHPGVRVLAQEVDRFNDESDACRRGGR